MRGGGGCCKSPRRVSMFLGTIGDSGNSIRVLALVEGFLTCHAVGFDILVRHRIKEFKSR